MPLYNQAWFERNNLVCSLFLKLKKNLQRSQSLYVMVAWQRVKGQLKRFRSSSYVTLKSFQLCFHPLPSNHHYIISRTGAYHSFIYPQWYAKSSCVRSGRVQGTWTSTFLFCSCRIKFWHFHVRCYFQLVFTSLNKTPCQTIESVALQLAAKLNCPEAHFWNGTSCKRCSGCPIGQGVKTNCSKSSDTICQDCWSGYDYSNSTGMEACKGYVT